MRTLDATAAALLVLDGINCGLLGLFGANPLPRCSAGIQAHTRLAYVSVGSASPYTFV